MNNTVYIQCLLAMVTILLMTWIFLHIFLKSEFDLTFQKWIVSLPNENNHKTHVKCWQP